MILRGPDGAMGPNGKPRASGDDPPQKLNGGAGPA